MFAVSVRLICFFLHFLFFPLRKEYCIVTKKKRKGAKEYSIGKSTPEKGYSITKSGTSKKETSITFLKPHCIQYYFFHR